MGHQHFGKADWDEAIAAYTTAIETGDYLNESSLAEAYACRAGALCNRGHTGDAEKALQDLDKAVEMNPRYARAYLTRAMIYHGQDKYADAIQNFDLAEKFHFENRLVILRDRAQCKNEVSDFQGAIDDASSALRLSPKDWVSLWARGRAYHRRGWIIHHRRNPAQAVQDYQKAIADYQAAIPLIPADHPFATKDGPENIRTCIANIRNLGYRY
jgi:Flp pilus assembly protein TadD